jgi:beta-lactamase regulating signal transducer with metallopeptidase domain/HEAT repeat protein
MIPTLDFSAPSGHVSLPLLILLGKATVLLLAALGATMAMRRASAVTRHLVWLVALGALLALPALSAWGPVKVAVLPAARAERASTENHAPSAERAPVAAFATLEATAGSARLSVQSPRAESREPRAVVPALADLAPTTLAFGLWALVAAAFAAWLGFGALSVSRIVRRARVLDDASWRTPLIEIADRLGIDDAPRLVRSDDIKMPFACGLLHPTIVLPAESDAWTLERRRAVLLHELGHVRRRDLIGHTLGRLACAAYWFHPLVWTAAKQLRAESERACDDLALTCGARASDYAEHLLDIVTGVRHASTPAVAMAMARRKEFEGRMLAILDPELRRRGPSRRQATTLVGALAVLSVVVGATAPVARAADESSRAPPTAARGRGGDANVERDAASHAVTRVQTRTTTRTDTVTREERSRRRRASDEFSRSDEATRDERTDARVDARNDALDHALRDARTDARTDVQNDIQREFARELPAVTHLGKTVAGAAAGAALGAIDSALRNHSNTRNPLNLLLQSRQGSGDDRPTLLANVLRTDSSAELRRVAAWGLEQYADKDVAMTALIGALRSDKSAEVREMAAWALANADRQDKARDALVAALKGDADAKVRSTAAWALGNAGDEDAIPALIEVLGNESSALRMRAAWAIGSIEPRTAPRQVVALLNDKEPRVRKAAAWALFQIEDPETVNALDAALSKESDSDVRKAEIRALAAMGEKSIDAIKKLLDTKDQEVRAMAIKALAGTHAGGPWPWPWPDPRPYP